MRTSLLNMDASKDCYFYYYSTCKKGSDCPFRHCEAALGTETVCTRWLEGQCTQQNCRFRHMEKTQYNRSMVPCYWESRTGCLKPHCVFKHFKPRPQSSCASELENLILPTTTQPSQAPSPMSDHPSEYKLRSKDSPETRSGRSSISPAPVQIAPVVVSLNDGEESDNESTAAPVGKSAKDLQNQAGNDRIDVKTLEQLKMEKIHRESDNFYKSDQQPMIPDAQESYSESYMAPSRGSDLLDEDLHPGDLRSVLKRKLAMSSESPIPVLVPVPVMPRKRVISANRFSKKTDFTGDSSYITATFKEDNKGKELEKVRIKTLEEIRKEKLSKSRNRAEPSQNEISVIKESSNIIIEASNGSKEVEAPTTNTGIPKARVKRPAQEIYSPKKKISKKNSVGPSDGHDGKGQNSPVVPKSPVRNEVIRDNAQDSPKVLLDGGEKSIEAVFNSIELPNESGEIEVLCPKTSSPKPVVQVLCSPETSKVSPNRQPVGTDDIPEQKKQKIIVELSRSPDLLNELKANEISPICKPVQSDNSLKGQKTSLFQETPVSQVSNKISKDIVPNSPDVSSLESEEDNASVPNSAVVEIPNCIKKADAPKQQSAIAKPRMKRPSQELYSPAKKRMIGSVQNNSVNADSVPNEVRTISPELTKSITQNGVCRDTSKENVQSIGKRKPLLRNTTVFSSVDDSPPFNTFPLRETNPPKPIDIDAIRAFLSRQECSRPENSTFCTIVSSHNTTMKSVDEEEEGKEQAKLEPEAKRADFVEEYSCDTEQAMESSIPHPDSSQDQLQVPELSCLASDVPSHVEMDSDLTVINLEKESTQAVHEEYDQLLNEDNDLTMEDVDQQDGDPDNIILELEEFLKS